MDKKKKQNSDRKMIDSIRDQMANSMFNTVLSFIISIENSLSWLFALLLSFPVVQWMSLPLTQCLGNLYVLLAMLILRPAVLSVVTMIVCGLNLVAATQMAKKTEERLSQGEELLNVLKNMGIKTDKSVVPPKEE